jgi:hypothetical protein
VGHIRLGTIPKSQPWRDVVESVVSTDFGRDNGSQDVWLPEIAAKTLEAAQGGLERAIDDDGLKYAFYLLTQVALRSRDEDWLGGLRNAGIEITPTSTAFDLSSAFQAAVDEHLFSAGVSSDISEIAQRAAGDVLCSLVGERAVTLFGDTGEELRLAVRSLSTKSGFAHLGQEFFGRFLARYLNFYLSRITATQIGRGRIGALGDISQFNSELIRHCEQSAGIVRDFAGEWYSKTEYQRGITPENASGFVAVAIKKLQAELQAQRAA